MENQGRAFIKGQRLYLRGVELGDASGPYYRWMNDPEITQYLESRFFPNSVDSLQDYIKAQRASTNSVLFAIVLNGEDRHIGNIKLGGINWIHRHADVGIIIGEQDCWGKGYASEAIGLVATYAFKTLNLHKLIAGIYGGNTGSSKAFRKVGFVQEALLRQHYCYKGTYLDSELWGLLASEHEQQS